MSAAGLLQSIPATPHKWSGAKTPPALGERVTITFNGLGAGVVVGFKVVEGYLGVAVKLDSSPEWRTKQGVAADVPAFVFGAELVEQRAPAVEVLTRAPWKFEGFKAGQIIRARDFEDRAERGACYVEGRIDMVCPEGSDRYPYAHYKIVPTLRVWNGSALRDAMTEPREVVIVPMETSMDYENRVELIPAGWGSVTA